MEEKVSKTTICAVYAVMLLILALEIYAATYFFLGYLKSLWIL